MKKGPSSEVYHSNHPVESMSRLTEVEQVAERYEIMHENRISVTFSVKNRLLVTCRRIAKAKKLHMKIPLQDLLDLREQARNDIENKSVRGLYALAHAIGFYDESQMFLEVLDRAIERVTKELKADYFYYQDFSFYFIHVISRWPWFRSSFMTYVIWMMGYYVLTPVFFCVIAKDDQVCPRDRTYGGWLTGLYFASATLSTVGYGDVTIIADDVPQWRVLIGMFYMIISVIVLVTAFNSVAGTARNPVDDLEDYLLNHYGSDQGNQEKFLHEKLRRIYIIKLTVIAVEFISLNVIGAIVARMFTAASNDPEENWTWIETFYWSIQTTTTIGYGDLSTPYEMRWFQIFYLVISTYFVGDSLSRVGSLSRQSQEIRAQLAWSSREVSQGMLEDMQAYEHDDKIDQYEFVVASLLSLRKIEAKDVRMIMEKFKILSKGGPFITLDDSEVLTPYGRDSDSTPTESGK